MLHGEGRRLARHGSRTQRVHRVAGMEWRRVARRSSRKRPAHGVAGAKGARSRRAGDVGGVVTTHRSRRRQGQRTSSCNSMNMQRRYRCAWAAHGRDRAQAVGARCGRRFRRRAAPGRSKVAASARHAAPGPKRRNPRSRKCARCKWRRRTQRPALRRRCGVAGQPANERSLRGRSWQARGPRSERELHWRGRAPQRNGRAHRRAGALHLGPHLRRRRYPHLQCRASGR